MAERQVSQHGSMRENVTEWEDDDVGENDNVRQSFSQRSHVAGSNAGPANNDDQSNAIGMEVKELLQVMVRQQAVQNKKLGWRIGWNLRHLKLIWLR